MSALKEIRSKLSKIAWSENKTSSSSVIENNSIPLIVKPTKDFLETYSLSKNCYVLLHHRFQTHRIVCQTIEEGAYMVGPQVEIPSTYLGTFFLRQQPQRDEEPTREFSSVRDIAAALPERVYPQTRMSIHVPIETGATPNESNTENIVTLRAGEPLLVGRTEDVVSVAQPSIGNYIEQMFGQKRSPKQVTIPCLVVTSNVTHQMHKIPLSYSGKFATRCPHFAKEELLDVRDIITTVGVPATLIPTDYNSENLMDKHKLKTNTPLRIISMEEHDCIIGVTTDSTIIEISKDGAQFYLPASMDDKQTTNEIAYKECVHDLLLQCEIKYSDINVTEYCKSITLYTARTKRPTNPRALSTVASNRTFVFPPRTKVSPGLSAIYFLANAQNNHVQILQSLPPLNNNSDSMIRRKQGVPLPAPPVIVESATNDNQPATTRQGNDGPPLPPRNRNSLIISNDENISINQSAMSKPYIAPPPPDFPAPIASSRAIENKKHLDDDEWGTVGDIFTPGNISNPPTTAQGCSPTNIPTNNRPPLTITPPMDTSVTDSMQQGPTDPSNAQSDTTQHKASSPVFNMGAPAELYQVMTPSPRSSPKPSRKFYLSGGENNGDQLYNNVARVPSFSEEGYENATLQNGSYVATNENDYTVNPSQVVENSTQSALQTGGKCEPDHCFTSSSNISSSSSEATHLFVDSQLSIVQTQSSIVSNQFDDKFVQVSNIIRCPNQTSNTYGKTPPEWRPPDNTHGASVQEVAWSLRYIGMPEEIVSCFQNEQIDGELLHEINDEMMKTDFGLGSFYRKKISMFLSGWRPNFAPVLSQSNVKLLDM